MRSPSLPPGQGPGWRGALPRPPSWPGPRCGGRPLPPRARCGGVPLPPRARCGGVPLPPRAWCGGVPLLPRARCGGVPLPPRAWCGGVPLPPGQYPSVVGCPLPSAVVGAPFPQPCDPSEELKFNQLLTPMIIIRLCCILHPSGRSGLGTLCLPFPSHRVHRFPSAILVSTLTGARESQSSLTRRRWISVRTDMDTAARALCAIRMHCAVVPREPCTAMGSGTGRRTAPQY